jgi:hypothetical protein
MSAREARLLPLAAAAVALSWLPCWALARALLRPAFAAALVTLRSSTPRRRRARLARLVAAAPLYATAFNLLLWAALASPLLWLDANNMFGLASLVLSHACAVHPRYAAAAAAAALVGLVAGVAKLCAERRSYSTATFDAALGVSAGAWAAAATVGAVAAVAYDRAGPPQDDPGPAAAERFVLLKRWLDNRRNPAAAAALADAIRDHRRVHPDVDHKAALMLA